MAETLILIETPMMPSLYGSPDSVGRDGYQKMEAGRAEMTRPTKAQGLRKENGFYTQEQRYI